MKLRIAAALMLTFSFAVLVGCDSGGDSKQPKAENAPQMEKKTPGGAGGGGGAAPGKSGPGGKSD